MISSQIGPGSRYQRCQPGEKVLGSEQNMSGDIAERVLEFVAHMAGCVGRQPRSCLLKSLEILRIQHNVRLPARSCPLVVRLPGHTDCVEFSLTCRIASR